RVAPQSAPYGVAKLEKGTTLPCVLRLVWRALWGNAVRDETSTGPSNFLTGAVKSIKDSI
ncbi:hypothetical protein, partial [Vreelandella boliviensis]|uniref:hypothetical protein n=1 Tax=Vreelandella boliviensis TaxID=223527 RepID=UPI001AD84088